MQENEERVMTAANLMRADGEESFGVALSHDEFGETLQGDHAYDERQPHHCASTNMKPAVKPGPSVVIRWRPWRPSSSAARKMKSTVAADMLPCARSASRAPARSPGSRSSTSSSASSTLAPPGCGR